MAKKNWFKRAGCKTKEHVSCSGTGGCFYFLGFIGMFAYHLGTAPTLLDLVIGFLQSIVWPAFFVYGLMSFIGA